MAKQILQTKQTSVKSHNGVGLQQEHTQTFDDNLLPDAVEISKLQQLDPNIMEWLKSHADKEQAFRHNSVQKRDQIIHANVKGEINLNFYGITCAFLIILSGMALSAFLIEKNHVITGSVFSGFTLIYAGALFIRKKANNDNTKKN